MRILVAVLFMTGAMIALVSCTTPANPSPTPAPVVTPIPLTTAPAALTPPASPTAQPNQAPAATATSKPIPSYQTTLAGFQTERFRGPDNCAQCHSALTDAAGTDVSNPAHWRSTSMAHASKDPIWQAKVSSEAKRIPKLQATIEEKCAGCHMPMAETEVQIAGGKVLVLDNGFLNRANPLHAAAMDGVSCTLCHQIQAQNLGEKSSFSGGYVIDAKTQSPERPIFGPYPNPVAQQMQALAGYTPVYGGQKLKAELCATCHNLYTPYVDAQGNIVGEFAEQTPYTEWKHSAFAAGNMICQDCHMPKAQGGVQISTIPRNGLEKREPFYQHHFAGGNAMLLQILRDHGPELNVSADPAQFDETITRTQKMLQGAATLSVQQATLEGNLLKAQLRVVSSAGHKFPTSIPIRRLWLHVTIKDAAGKVIFESGKPQPDGSIVGNDADINASAFEPHYDLIQKSDQVQVYEAIMADADGNVTYTLLRAARYLKDNRLLPPGFDKKTAPADIAVYGDAAQDDSFGGGGDLINYHIDVSGSAGPFTLHAELLYQPLQFRFMQDLFADNTDLSNRLAGYYAQADKTPTLVAASAPTIVK